jgi:hypothetical protein
VATRPGAWSPRPVHTPGTRWPLDGGPRGLPHLQGYGRRGPEASVRRMNFRYCLCRTYIPRTTSTGVHRGPRAMSDRVRAGRLFAHKPERCPYGHSLAPGMPQKISWMPCICPGSRSREPGPGDGHLTLWCGTCSAQDHRDTRFCEPPHQVGYNGPVSGWMTQPDVLAPRTRRPGDGHGRGLVRGQDRDHADDLLGRVRAHDAGRPGRRCLLGRHGELGRTGMGAVVPVDSDGDVVAAGWFGYAWDCKSGI